jgi:cysteine desulfurase/selenocysteine lyase
MIRTVELHHSTFADVPAKFEAGTPPIAEAVGLGAAADYLANVGLDAIRAHEVELTGHMLDALAEVDGITVYGPKDPELRGGAVSFSLPDIHPHDIAQLIDRDGVCVRAGHHCAKPLMRVLGVGATARASTYLYNSREDIDTLVRALGNARAMFK